MSLVKTSGIMVPNDHPEYDAIKQDLNRYVSTWDGGTENLVFYEELKTGILIPRYYPVNDEIIDKSSEGEDIEIEHTVVPRNERQQKSIDFLVNNLKGILRLEPGSGKTVIAVATIATVKKRAIIFAHKDKLLEDGWKAEFLQFTNLKEEDIGRLSSDNYKECLKKKIILSTPHVIANAVKKRNVEFLKTLAKAKIGIMLVDEIHAVVGPTKFSKASLFVNAKRTYGLSATPSRSDGMNDILVKHVGEVTYFPPEKNELLNPAVHMVYFPFGIYKKHRQYLSWGGNFSLARYHKMVLKCDKYHTTLSTWIVKAYKAGRVVLVLGKEIKPLLRLAKECDLPPEHVGIFIPGAIVKEYFKQVDALSDTRDLTEAFKTKQVVFSTYGACRDGNNRKDLDVLVMATPTSNPEQAVGRILRELQGKSQPIVIDVVDTDGPSVDVWIDGARTPSTWFERSALKRMEFYETKGWEIKVHKGK
jgi:superfamily II DNA or RNA helicase